MELEKLITKSNEIRRLSLTSIYEAGSGHPGGVLSCAEIVTYIYDQLVNLNDHNRLNKFVLSKGHAAPVIYAAAAVDTIVEKSEVCRLRKLGSPMQGHPSVEATPWVETSTGSLGQGFSAAIGMAMGMRHQGKDARIYTLLGDGELQEGEIWEGAMCAAHYKLDNLCAVIDYNKMQSDDLNQNIMGLESLTAKWLAFNWNVIEIDGHDFVELDKSFKQADSTKTKPTVIIANTIKGKGVSYMEDQPAWHGSVALKVEELKVALEELGVSSEDLPSYFDVNEGE